MAGALKLGFAAGSLTTGLVTDGGVETGPGLAGLEGAGLAGFTAGKEDGCVNDGFVTVVPEGLVSAGRM